MITIILFLFLTGSGQIFLPFKTGNRKDISQIKLTAIGQFGLMRKARPGIPAHLHTGIDIKRPGNNYGLEPIFPIAEGRVISKRIDGPFAHIIIEHSQDGKQFWSLYEHIAGIEVGINDYVTPKNPVARYMNKQELNRYGWQFDHFHLEILKIRPQEIRPDKKHPERFFNSYSLICFTPEDLKKYYYDPLEFLGFHLKQ